MVIYSEITGKNYKSVDECLREEEIFLERKQKAEERRRKEREQIEAEVRNSYENLVTAWRLYLKWLDKAGIEVEDMEDKALIFVEVVLDADDREIKHLKS